MKFLHNTLPLSHVLNLNTRKRIIIICVCIIVLCTFIFSNSFFTNKLVGWGLIAEASYYTELYINDAIAAQNETDDSIEYFFSFTIHNNEGSEIDYFYSVYLLADDGTTAVDIGHGTTRIKNKDEKTLIKSIVLPDSIKQGEVRIDLPELNQSVHFKVPLNS